MIKVLVVDDSVVIRRLVSDLLAADPEIEVVGTAVNGRAGVEKVAALEPDLVTMDIEMPEVDGIEAVRRIRATGSKVPVIMFSTLTERGAAATLDALAAGASDYVAKPANVGSVGRSMEQVRDALIPRIKSLVPQAARPEGRPGTRTSARQAAPTREARPIALRPPRPTPAGGHRLVLVGSSTGGPEALGTLLAALPPLPVPVVVVQHMPPLFTRQLAARLDRNVAARVVEAEHGQPLLPGTVAIAPGDHHLHVTGRPGRLAVRLSQEPPENYCRPAVDVLLRSAVEAVGGAALGVVLTGMGQDGCRGAQVLVDAGGSVLAQDQATSVVWGMPGAVAGAGLAEQVLPLADIAPELVRRLAPQRTAVPVAGASR
ncbi:chemotaxis-specific protein-glutamate methyltransferase CheB [Nocardioides deserti]|uniref:Protein-glutamate methylesterase/protein-glutamine glutaminase n=1 Tax=Nocardioides deserti TaxID=1588644 RepID=A0ABR6UDM1_9ACTN|nr:chemotaxis-specific protein-glutamate methyltransferase CheB [Nocardioides deserti]MBC2962443.1 chemotaxis-specific protein-glutamate methyltransferase CheB [Nocardioides deserti]GGO78035.1 chemotaxis response regulator protein-glutamate methylesterase [Nocardioides deserti]